MPPSHEVTKFSLQAPKAPKLLHDTKPKPFWVRAHVRESFSLCAEVSFLAMAASLVVNNSYVADETRTVGATHTDTQQAWLGHDSDGQLCWTSRKLPKPSEIMWVRTSVLKPYLLPLGSNDAQAAEFIESCAKRQRSGVEECLVNVCFDDADWHARYRAHLTTSHLDKPRKLPRRFSFVRRGA